MKLNEQEAEVCLGENEVKVDDKVVLFKNDCSHVAPKLAPGLGVLPVSPYAWVTRVPVCHKAEVGSGKIIRTLNEHYSVMKADPGVQFEVGTIVEKNN